MRSFCLGCGNSLAEGERFCGACGRDSQAGPGVAPVDPQVAFGLPPETSGKAIFSLICGILFVILPLSIVAVIFGYIALSEIRKSPGRLKGRGLAITGIVLGWLLPILVLVSGALGTIRRVVGPPWVWDAVHHSLDALQRDVFETEKEDALHHHRVTLFKRVGWRWCFAKWPWSGWLLPVERSGHTTQLTRAAFRAPDDADNAEGVAGLTWASNRVRVIENLPDLSVGRDEDFEAYARATGVTVSWLKSNMPKSRSFGGIPVEVKSKLWGVLILDSRSPNGIKKDSTNLYRPMSKVLAKLLERV